MLVQIMQASFLFGLVLTHFRFLLFVQLALDGLDLFLFQRTLKPAWSHFKPLLECTTIVASYGVGTYYFVGPQNTQSGASLQVLTNHNNVFVPDDFLRRDELVNGQDKFDSFRRHPICCLELELKRNFTGQGEGIDDYLRMYVYFGMIDDAAYATQNTHLFMGSTDDAASVTLNTLTSLTTLRRQ